MKTYLYIQNVKNLITVCTSYYSNTSLAIIQSSQRKLEEQATELLSNYAQTIDPHL